MIVGDNSDLNVYKTAGVDGTEAGCCGPVSAKKQSCCGGKKSDEGDELLRDLDLNQWAGKLLLSFSSLKRWKLTFRQALSRYLRSKHSLPQLALTLLSLNAQL